MMGSVVLSSSAYCFKSHSAREIQGCVEIGRLVRQEGGGTGIDGTYSGPSCCS
jgi:hypothetical protein